MKKALYILLFLNFSLVFSQKKYPQNTFRNPLDIPIVLAGTFGELRSNHFHSGIDIKTQGVSGKKVYTAKEGYVSRIKVSLWGYGKALYVTHPNGYTTVYGHLSKFSDKIEKYVKAKQYEKESFAIQLFPGKNELTIDKDEIIAFSGNTGGSSAPHLHFEIRDTGTEKIINPLLFGYEVKDNIAPKLLGLRVSPLNTTSAVNSISATQEIRFTKKSNHTFVADSITAIGTIGLAIKTHDLLNAAPNKNGVYSVDMYVNDTLKYHHDLETFAFSESKYINLLIDYELYAKKRRRYQKTYIEKANKLSIYKNNIGKGSLTIKNNKNYDVTIVIKDIEDNKTSLIIPIQGNNHIKPILKKDTKTPYFVKHTEYTVFKEGNSEIRFPKNTFYEDLYLDYKAETNKATVHKPIVPLHKKYTIAFFTDSLTSSQKKHAYIGLKKKNYFSFIGATQTKNKLHAKTKHLGDFYIKYDSIAPKIYKPNFTIGQNINKHKTLSIRIKDTHTGIKNYYATIDGKWTLMEYNPKNNKLTYNLNDLAATNTKHTFKIKVRDLLGNTKTFTSNFIK